jgi:hypothetical protein
VRAAKAGEHHRVDALAGEGAVANAVEPLPVGGRGQGGRW